MSNPTSDQLAPNVDPLVRDYIAAYVSEQIALASAREDLQHTQLRQLAEHIERRMAELELFERQVRSHLRIFVPEAK
jgi:3-methyladenine DNA glycosylase AlkD